MLSKVIGKIGRISDPVLQFDSINHIATDPIFGLESWDPHKLPDLECINICAVCSPQYIKPLKQFWEHLKEGYTEDVWVPHPGFRSAFGIPVTDLGKIYNPDPKPGDIPTRYASAVKDVEKFDLAFVVLPYETMADAFEVYNEIKASSFSKTPRIKTQCIRRSTLERLDKLSEAKGEKQKKSIRSDHAIDLWNITVGIFTKVGGTPWILKNPMSEVGCFIGMVTNARAVAERQYVRDKAGICEVVDSYGSHIIWAKEDLPSMTWTKIEGQHVLDIKPDEIQRLVESCLDRYCRQLLGPGYEDRISSLSHKSVVFHVTDRFSDNVLDAMEKGISGYGLKRYQILHLEHKSPHRLYEEESNDLIPLRGTFWEIDANNAVLYTHGKREYRRGVVNRVYSRHKRVSPIAVEILRQNKAPTIDKACEHVINLTALCWYTTDIELRMPVTIKIARRLSELWKRNVLTDFEDVRWVL
jgi:hypothetical protein